MQITSKKQLTELYEETLDRISESPEAWAKFLRFCGQNYKYAFTDLVLIYAQCPHATAIATMEQWDKLFGLKIMKGSTAIRVFDDTVYKGYAAKYFDVSATEGPEDSKPVLWQFERKCTEAVFSALNVVYDETIPMHQTIQKIMDSIIAENIGDTEPQLKQAMSAGAALAVCYRMGLDCDELVQAAYPQGYFSVSGMVSLIGAAITESTEKCLRVIERSVKHERRNEQLAQNNRQGRDNIPSGRVDHDLRPADRLWPGRDDRGDSSGQIRSTGAEIPQRASSDALLQNAGGNDTAALPQSVGRGDGAKGASDSSEAAGSVSQAQRRELHSDGAVEEHGVPEGRGAVDGGILSAVPPGEPGRAVPASPRSEIIIKEFGNRPTLRELLAGDAPKSKEKPSEAPLFATPEASPQLTNYVYQESDRSPSGVAGKFKHNVEAIKLLKQIEAAGRNATPEEQSVLAGYAGWGGLPQAFDPENHQWANEYKTLRELLDENEYQCARSSTPNAHYTPPEVIQSIYKALATFGFEGGRVIDPALGVGGFFAHYPQEWMDKTTLYGVELDSLSGRIAKQLYPNANIRIQGFESTDYPDGYFDVFVGNVPFGNYRLFDSQLNGQNLLIHDYFFAKSLLKVRPGGMIIFVTSKGTMDKKDSSFRRYMAQRANLIGAIRLPNNAFTASANTEVTSDILFLQKRSSPIFELTEQELNWVELGETPDGIPVNRYFQLHPEMMLGKIVRGTNQFGETTELAPIEGMDLSAQLAEAVSHLHGRIMERDTEEEKYILADPSVKNYSYTVFDGSVYYREGGIMNLVEGLRPNQVERIQGMDEIRRNLHALLDMQVKGCTDEELAAAQQDFNALYDKFAAKHGYLNAPANYRLFAEDCDAALLLSLEVENSEEDGLEANLKTYSKADVFFKRTLGVVKEITSVDNAQDALLLSLNNKGHIDFDYIRELYDRPLEAIIEELGDQVYLDPLRYDAEDLSKGWLTADEYLSGNVRAKLEVARQQENQTLFARNVAALEQVLPPWLEAGDIEVRLGATWISEEYYNQFIYGTFGTPNWYRGTDSRSIHVSYNSYKNAYFIHNKTLDCSAKVKEKFGTARMSAYHIMEESLNLRNAVVKDAVPYITPNGNESVKYVVNHAETVAARQRQSMIHAAFKEWVFKDPQRRNTLVAEYNNRFNSIRQRHYDGSYLTFPGMNPAIKLEPHQKDSVLRIISGNNTLLAHVVGAGKTYTMIAGAMEQLRLGLATKVVFTVPNHLTQQFGKAIYTLYPQAKAMITTKEDFEKSNRQRFLSRIALSDVQMVVIGHSQFEKISMSIEYMREKIQQDMDMLMEGIDQAKRERSEQWTIKQMESQRKSLEAQLNKLLDASKKDTMLTFEQLGIDSIFVDEAHYFKNLAVFSKMTNVAGISNAKAKKASDMLMKCDYLTEMGKSITFATGTPLSNSMAEMYVMQRYLQQPLLLEKGIRCFDEWASIFGETTTSLELAPEGNGYRLRTRFAKFHNIPELMQMFCQIADIRTADMLNLPVPKLAGGKPIVIVSHPSPELEAFMKDGIERVNRIRNGEVPPTEDNMLKFIGDARRAGLDMRLIDPHAPFDKGGKIAQCAQRIYTHYVETSNDKGTQIVFCDVSVPGPGKSFDAYNGLKDCLVNLGIPADEIAFMTDAKNDRQKEELFANVREGSIRVLVGSTVRCGAGTNIQDRLIALHHLDCPYRPSDIEQREGRIIRRGNMYDEVYVYRYVTERSFDAYLWNIVETKQRFISQIMTGKSHSRDCEDIDEAVLSYAEAQAIASGNPHIKEKIEVDAEVQRLNILKSQHLNQRYRLQDKLAHEFPQKEKALLDRIERVKQDIEWRDSTAPSDFVIDIGGKHFDNREKAAQYLIALGQSYKPGEEPTIGNFSGFKLVLHSNLLSSQKEIHISGNLVYSTELIADSGMGNITRIENILKNLEGRLEQYNREFEQLNESVQAARDMLAQPFEQEQELARALRRQAELNQLLDVTQSQDYIPEELGDEELQHTDRHQQGISEDNDEEYEP